MQDRERDAKDVIAIVKGAFEQNNYTQHTKNLSLLKLINKDFKE